MAAVFALFGQVFINDGGSREPFDTDPELINGCGDLSGCIVQIPYGVIPMTITVLTAGALNGFNIAEGLGPLDDRLFLSMPANSVGLGDNFNTYAVFSLSTNGNGVSPVPLPAALPLFGSALAMLGMVGWRRKRWAAA